MVIDPPPEPHDAVMTCRAPKSVKKRIQADAKRTGVSVSAWLLDAALSKLEEGKG